MDQISAMWNAVSAQVQAFPAAFALLQIMFINVVLSGDNAVVIAMACRRLSPAHQKQAFIWGSVGVVILMVILTVFVVFLLSLPYLQIAGSLMLLWIGIKLLMAEDEGEDGTVEQKESLMAAIKTIVIADIIMSLDNVLAMAAVAKEHMWMLVVGLVITIPVILFGSALLVKLMARFPVIIVIGGALIGKVAGDMIIGDPAIKDWVEATLPSAHWLSPVFFAVLVVAAGKILERALAKKDRELDLP
ncbi:MAG: TerC family protein [Rhodospirillales bacterium]